MQSMQISEDVKRYIAEEFLDGDDQDLETNSPLLEWGILDSVGMVKLVSYLESQFEIRIPQSEITPTNFRDVDRISSMVVAHSARPPAAPVGSSIEADPELVELIDFGAESRTVRLESGARYHTIEMAGEGPTWLLLPEPGEPATFFGDVQRALEGHYRSIAVDLLGFGASFGPAPEPSFGDQAGSLVELLRHDPDSHYVVVGHGLSGALALELGRRAPEQIRAVVCLGFGEVPPRSLVAADGVQSFLAPRRRTHRELPAQQLESAAARISAPAFASFLDRDAEERIPALFAEAVTPTLYLAALEDELVPSAAVEAAEKKTSNSELKWLARAGHGFPRERADEAVSMMKNYVISLS